MPEAASPQAPTPRALLMQMASGFMSTFLLRVAAQLRLADYLVDGSQTVEQLAALTGTHAPALYRLLRTLASLGIFSEEDSGRFSLTPLAEPLRSNIPGSVRTSILSITGDFFVLPWSKLLFSVQTGRPSFDEHFGAPFFDHLSGNPEEATWFSDLLIGINAPDAPAVAAAYDFSAYRNIADIGGATGHILTTVLTCHPSPQGTLFELAHNEAAAMELIQSRGMANRVTFVPGSFFESIPTGSDLYMMSHVIHDWSEDQCLLILANCHRAMAPGSRLLLIESVLPEGSTFHPAKMLDITMLTLAGGQERTEAEYRELLQKAGFKLTRIIPTEAAVSIVEAVPA
jgi:hypothetical protein